MSNRDREPGLLDEVITIRFHNKVTKGGRNLSCAALVAVGDGKGTMGLGYGKAKGVPMAIEKASKEARKSMFKVCMVGDTIGHEAMGAHKAARVLLKPARPGTGVKAGGTVRSIMRVLGVHNVLSKVFGPTNPLNVAKATVKALSELRSAEEVERLRGCRLQLFHPQATVRAGSALTQVTGESAAAESTEAEAVPASE
jgi:small subunit ribosomal protein S5